MIPDVCDRVGSPVTFVHFDLKKHAHESLLWTLEWVHALQPDCMAHSEQHWPGVSAGTQNPPSRSWPWQSVLLNAVLVHARLLAVALASIVAPKSISMARKAVSSSAE